MSEENIDKVRRGYEYFNRGDFDAALAFVHPHVEIVRPAGQSTLRGAEKVRAWMEPDALESQVIEPLKFTVEANKILVELNVKARGAASGIELKFRSWNVWTFDGDGLATRVEAFLAHEQAEALEAAGLSNS